MKRLMLGAALCVLSLISAPQAQAQPGGGRPGGGRPGGPGRGPVVVSPGRGPSRGPVIVTPGRGHFHPGHAHGRPYFRDHGVRFSGGYFYRGHGHSHWSHRHWDPVHRRYHYFDPFLSCYFYWCPSRLGYYPIGTCLVD